jgi:cyanophycin synthetase
VNAASKRDIPFRRLNTGSLVQLGEGKHQRRTWTAETDATSALAESIASDKELTKRLLRAVGVPVPRGRTVESADDAWEAAQEIGLPVAIKPRQANHARGISLDLTKREQIAPAYEFALEDGDYTGVMVEQFAPGDAHRLLVVGDRMVAAARGESEHVTGDGVHTIRELVDEVNRDPRRGENYSDLLNLLKLDAGALIELQKQGLSPESVPAAGQCVLVQPVGDLTTDVTHLVHPQNAAHAVLAAKAVGLDIAGIDLVAQDISRPLEEQRGMILEVNAGPSLAMHIAPLHGQPQPVGEAIVGLLFKPGETGRVPIAAVTGPGDRRAIVEQVEQAWLAAGLIVGAATSDGIRVAGRPIVSDAATDADRLRTLLLHPEVEAVVFESQPAEAARRGLGCARCDLVIVASPSKPVEDDLDPQDMDGIVAAARAVPAGGTLLVCDRGDYERAIHACRGRVEEFTAIQLSTAASVVASLIPLVAGRV